MWILHVYNWEDFWTFFGRRSYSVFTPNNNKLHMQFLKIFSLRLSKIIQQFLYGFMVTHGTMAHEKAMLIYFVVWLRPSIYSAFVDFIYIHILKEVCCQIAILYTLYQLIWERHQTRIDFKFLFLQRKFISIYHKASIGSLKIFQVSVQAGL